MSDFWERLKQRKLVQWALAYLAAAWALLQVLEMAADSYGWPVLVMRLALGAATLGFAVTLLLAWYHGERGAQKVSGTELLLLALVLAVGGVLVWRVGARSSPARAEIPAATAPPGAAIGAQPAAGAKSIAVLPFENLSAEKDNEYFVAGMQDLILTKLAEIGELKVISRTSTLKYRSRPENLRQVGAELGVASVLEGSVQRQGDAVLVNVQLIDTATDAHLWAQSYQRTLDNVFGVEGEVAGKVADALKARLTPAAVGRLATSLSDDPVADDLYLRAEDSLRRADTDFDTAQYRQAIALYRQAIARAPGFALALAHLSYAESVLAWFRGGGEDVEQLQSDARRHADEVLALAPDLPDAHIALGFSDYYGRGDYPAALRDFRRALDLRPNDDKALVAVGYVLRRQGHFDAALDSMAQAQVRDPRNSALALTRAETMMMLSRYGEADAMLGRALALDPQNLQARFRRSYAMVLSRGDIPAALAAARGDEPAMRLWRVELLALQRNYREAMALLESVPDTPDNFSRARFGQKALRQAELLRLMGRPRQARTLYEKALPVALAAFRDSGNQRVREAELLTFVATAELGLGQDDAALQALAKSRELVARMRDFADGPSWKTSIAVAYATAGRADLAVPMLAEALETPGIGINYSPAMLRLDPAWDPIRDSAQFRALLGRYPQ
jgi:TolB-like protein/cytochrome c-type biogenesis protein CcmH/NrfG